MSQKPCYIGESDERQGVIPLPEGAGVASGGGPARPSRLVERRRLGDGDRSRAPSSPVGRVAATERNAAFLLRLLQRATLVNITTHINQITTQLIHLCSNFEKGGRGRVPCSQALDQPPRKLSHTMGVCTTSSPAMWFKSRSGDGAIFRLAEADSPFCKGSPTCSRGGAEGKWALHKERRPKTEESKGEKGEGKKKVSRGKGEGRSYLRGLMAPPSSPAIDTPLTALFDSPEPPPELLGAGSAWRRTANLQPCGRARERAEGGGRERGRESRQGAV